MGTKEAGAVLLSLTLALAVPAAAQTVVGMSIVEGKPAALYDDGTWDFVIKPKARCKVLTKRIEACLDPKGQWTKARSDGQDQLANFSGGGTLWAVLYLDEAGLRDGITLEYLRQVVIDNAADGSGAMPEEIPVMSVLEAEVDGRPAETLVYGVEIDGTPFVLANTIVLMPDRSLQIVVSNIGREYTEDHEAAVAELLATLTLGEDEAD